MIGEASKGDLVQIHQVILTPEERTANIPECTKRVPYEMWVKGFLLNDEAKIGDTVSIKTFIGRRLSGDLVNVNPVYDHGFGKPRVELISASLRARRRLEEESRNANR